MNSSHEHRVALVTGGMGGIGTAISERLYKDGFRVVVTCSSQTARSNAWIAEHQKAGFYFRYFDCDISNWESAEQGFKKIMESVGTVDVLVNNAGITKDGTFRKMTLENWRSVIDTNLNGLFNTTKQVLEGMLAKGWGRIINISSTNGQRGQFGQTNYCAAKAGIHGFSMALARELAAKGITVNTVSPGQIRGNMSERMQPEALERSIAAIPVGRLGEPQEIASVVSWLASDESAYTTGADFSVNGGLHMQ